MISIDFETSKVGIFLVFSLFIAPVKRNDNFFFTIHTIGPGQYLDGWLF